MGLKIGLISDLHYGFPENKKMGEYLEPVAEEMIADINSFDPDIVISLGDFIQHSERKQDIRKLEKIGEIFDKSEKDLYAIPGNHDHITVSKDEALNLINAENDSSYFSLEIKEFKLIFIDTVTQIDDIYGAGLLGSDQREWLKKEIQTNKKVLIFSHHLLHNQNLEGNWFFDTSPELAACIDKNQFKEITGSIPKAVFSAHIHETGLKKSSGVPHFTTPGMDKYNPPDKFEKNHALIEISEDEIVFETPQETIKHSV